MNKDPAPLQVKRNFNCMHYSQCLDKAAKEDWEYFSCSACPKLQNKDVQNMDNKQQVSSNDLCACGKKVMRPGSTLCASCMAKRSAAKRKTNNVFKQNKKAEAVVIDSPCKEGSIRNGAILTIDFGEHAEILEGIERQAVEDMRPLDMQIIYALKKHLKGCSCHH